MSRSAMWMRAAGNVLLGIALGLLAYYGLTTLAGWLAQRALHAEVADVGTFDAEFPNDLLSPGAPMLDFEGWDEQDRAYWEALPEGGVFGRLVIDRMALDTLVVRGVATKDLKRGPGWIDWTDLPGPSGAAGIAGHRTTYLAPFRRIDELAPGDTIDLFSPYRRYRYRVVKAVVVTPDQWEVIAAGVRPTLTLTACHPPYSARYRLAVTAELEEVRRVENPGL